MFQALGLHKNLTQLLIAVYLLVGFDIASGAPLCHRNDTSRPALSDNVARSTLCCATSPVTWQAEGCGPCLKLAPLPPSIKPSVRLDRDVPQKTVITAFLGRLPSRRDAERSLTDKTFRQPHVQTARLQNISTVVLRH